MSICAGVRGFDNRVGRLVRCPSVFALRGTIGREKEAPPGIESGSRGAGVARTAHITPRFAEGWLEENCAPHREPSSRGVALYSESPAALPPSGTCAPTHCGPKARKSTLAVDWKGTSDQQEGNHDRFLVIVLVRDFPILCLWRFGRALRHRSSHRVSR
jgi:hypothetical protein